MKRSRTSLSWARTILLAATIVAVAGECAAQAPAAIPPSINTPDWAESRLGALDFKDGVPSKATLEKVYDNLDFTYAFRAFTDTMAGVSIQAIRRGFLNAGVKDNEVVVWSTMLDARSLHGVPNLVNGLA